MSENLPESWVVTPVQSIASVNPSQPDNVPADDTLVSFVPMPAVELLSGKMNPTEDRPWGKVKKGYTRFQEDDVLIAKITPSMENGKVALAKGLTNSVGAGSTEFHVLRLPTAIPPKYLVYHFLQEGVRREARANMTGTAGQLRVPPDFIREHSIHLAPLPEQHRIVAAIETYFSRLDKAVEALERVKANLKRYRASVLKAAVEGRLVPTEAELAKAEGRDYEPAFVLLERILKERRKKWEEAGGRGKYKAPAAPNTDGLPELPEGWCWATVEQLIREPLRNGHSAKFSKNGSIRILTLTAVTQGRFVEEYTKLTDADPNKVADLWLSYGDILVERSNAFELVGISALFKGPDNWAVFPDLMIRVRVSDLLNVDYVASVLKSKNIREYFRKSAQGISGSMPKISQSVIQNAYIPLPPLTEQDRIVSETERLLSVNDDVDLTIETNLQRTTRLRQAILKWAFEGKLADQDPNDEPASKLLERIRLEREGMKPKKTLKRVKRGKNK